MDLETIKSYDNGWWLEFLRRKTIFDVDNIKSHIDWLIERAEQAEVYEKALMRIGSNEFMSKESGIANEALIKVNLKKY
ncbi:hypothetical protein [Metabacillus sp. Hm71]|uniref:hypothetical protein n=1 Tax=Metabacillus sp. Hm71 TaxID=3450743 RepID=UPI003F4428D6